MRERSVRAITLVMVVALTGAVLPSGTSAQEEQRFQGIIQSTAGGRASGMTRVTIRISEFTSDEEVVRLITLLAEEGSRAVENEMVRTDVARFQLAGQRSAQFRCRSPPARPRRWGNHLSRDGTAAALV